MARKVLFAGPYYGEFGWELFSWQAYVRKIAADYDKVIVAIPKGSEALYIDFATDFITHEVPRVPEFWKYKKIDEQAKADFEKRLPTVGAQIIRPAFHPLKEQKFIRFGNPDADVPKYNILIHPRGKSLVGGTNPHYDYPVKQWEVLIQKLAASEELQYFFNHSDSSGGAIGMIGLPTSTLTVDGVADCRSFDLQRTMDIVRKADLVIGPSSGPMHLASLCGTPHIVWTDQMKRKVINGNNRYRYEKLWNPLQTPVHVIDEHGWQPSPDVVYEAIVSFVQQLNLTYAVDTNNALARWLKKQEGCCVLVAGQGAFNMFKANAGSIEQHYIVVVDTNLDRKKESPANFEGAEGFTTGPGYPLFDARTDRFIRENLSRIDLLVADIGDSDLMRLIRRYNDLLTDDVALVVPCTSGVTQAGRTARVDYRYQLVYV